MRYRVGEKKEWDADSVKALRRHLKRTQQQLAQDLGVRQQTISEWETGTYMPRGASRTLLNMIAEGAGFKYETGPEAGEASETGQLGE